jgi:PASTA domain
VTSPIPDELTAIFTAEAADICTAQEILDRATPHRRRRVLMPLVAVAVIVAVAVTITIVKSHRTSTTAPAPSVAAAPSTPAAPPHRVSIRVDLERTSYPADGNAIRGTAVITNNTGAPIAIPDGCNDWVAAGLANARYPFQPAFAGVGCATATLPTGVTRKPVIISTTTRGCLEPGGQSLTKMPACVGPLHDMPPRLPPGQYQTAIALDALIGIDVVKQTSRITLTAPAPNSHGSAAPGKAVIVPNVVGITEHNASARLMALHLLVKVQLRHTKGTAGTVLAQAPTAGQTVIAGSTILLTVSTNP